MLQIRVQSRENICNLTEPKIWSYRQKIRLPEEIPELYLQKVRLRATVAELHLQKVRLLFRIKYLRFNITKLFFLPIENTATERATQTTLAESTATCNDSGTIFTQSSATRTGIRTHILK